MAKIKPFSAIRPNPIYANELVFTRPSVESVVLHDPGKTEVIPLKDVLETVARHRPETPEGQMEAYRDIQMALAELLKTGRLNHDGTPGIYVYEAVHSGITQTGIWVLTSLEETERIKIHELTFADSVRRMQNYREYTRLEGSPVLLAYQSDETINRMIEQAKSREKHITLGNADGLHRIWKIEDKQTITELTIAFAGIGNVYLADGHHRLSSAAALTVKQRAENKQEYSDIAALYMALDQLQIREFHRIVLPGFALDTTELLAGLNQFFYVQESFNNQAVTPGVPHKLGLHINGKWFNITVKPAVYAGKSLSQGLDASLLQELVLTPFFGIHDPKTDARLKCVGGPKAFEQIALMIAECPQAIVFTLSPLSISELVGVADAGDILPPKSTWINPKIPYGLLLHQHTSTNHETS